MRQKRIKKIVVPKCVEELNPKHTKSQLKEWYKLAELYSHKKKFAKQDDPVSEVACLKLDEAIDVQVRQLKSPQPKGLELETP